ncbi:glycosyltransferase family 4 protein [Halovivax cerinus]|uniref:Glycosyltransferase family 4 protein n=1 Tax=Halovivax cerinus TaxID=1487865 RepID=A0ABD5NP38_9EURY|nr:glycosyltransferase family 4 protein [Halovivax cerinus]
MTTRSDPERPRVRSSVDRPSVGTSAKRYSLVYFVSTLSAGGAQIGMSRLFAGLDRDLYDVTVVCAYRGTDDVRAAIPGWVTVRELESVAPWRRPLVLSRTVASADVLVCSLFHATLVGRVLGRVHRVPVVVNWIHSERFSSRLRERAVVATNRLADRILADSPAVAEALVDDVGVDPDLVRTVPIAGVDTDEFVPAETDSEGTTDGGPRPAEASTPTPRRHSTARPLRVATVGSLVPPKKHVRVLETARELEARAGAPTVRFTIAGTGELADRLRSQRDELGLDTVEFVGFVDDVASFLRRHDVYLHTSAYEGLCIAALEAMACGLPVVSTRVGGLAHYVEDGASGYLLDEPDPAAFADALEQFSDPDRRRAFGRRGREIVETSYSQTALVSTFVRVVEECLAEAELTRTNPSGLRT